MSKKIVYDNGKTWVFNDQQGKVVAAYIPQNNLDLQSLWDNLSRVPFTRVHYISKYGKPNRTPRLTWAWGQVDANIPNPQFDPTHETSVLRVLPNPAAPQDPDLVHYRGLDFQSEVMPPWLESLAQHCRMVAIMNWGVDLEYNSVIIGNMREEMTRLHFIADVGLSDP